MKYILIEKIFFITLTLLLAQVIAYAQTVTFWMEAFENNCSSHSCNLQTMGYTGPNGAWTVSITGTEGDHPNAFFISCNENGNAAGQCGSGCGNDESLHIGNVVGSPNDCFWCPTGDCGAAYDAGGCIAVCHPCPNSVTTNKRAESPVINCTGKSNITIAFNYIENGQGATDNATLWYNNGSTWSQLSDMAKTSTNGCNGQGLWTAFSLSLPASADNNPNVKIAFKWANNNSGGTDPSFAVDDITLSAPVGSPPVAKFVSDLKSVCAAGCINFTDSTSGNPTSWLWSFPGGTPSSSTLQNPSNICYYTSGSYDVTLIACNASGCDTLISPAYVQVYPAQSPPVITPANPSICQGDSIVITASGGTNYFWVPSTGLSAGTGATVTAFPSSTTAYTVFASNSYNCFNSTPLTISVSPSFTESSVITNEYCDNDGSIDVTISGGSGGFIYQWSTGATTEDLNSINGGLYYLTVTSGACTKVFNFSVYVSVPFFGLTVNPLGSCQATLNWNAVSGANFYRVSKRTLPGGIWSAPFDVGNVTAYTFQNLLAGTKYEFSSIAVCGAGNDTLVYASVKKTTPMCTVPINPSVTSITNNSATVFWSEWCNPDKFKLQYRIQNSGNPWSSTNSLDTFKHLMNLLPSTTYDYRVRSVCPGPINSAFTSVYTFTTLAFAPPNDNKIAETKPSAMEVKIYPNPNPGSFTVELQSVSDQKLEIELLDELQRVLVSKTETVSSGSHLIPIEVPTTVSNGIYYLLIKNSSVRELHPIVVDH